MSIPASFGISFFVIVNKKNNIHIWPYLNILGNRIGSQFFLLFTYGTRDTTHILTIIIIKARFDIVH